MKLIDIVRDGKFKDSETLNRIEASELLGVCNNTLMALRAKGILTTIKDGVRVIFLKKELYEYLDSKKKLLIRVSNKSNNKFEKATKGSTGRDIHIVLDEPFNLQPGEIHLFRTELTVRVPFQTVCVVVSRSGLSNKGVIVLNAPGIIDPDYRGEIKVLLQNVSRETYILEDGDRVAQMIFLKESNACISDGDFYGEEDGERLDGGFGSTGK